nr:MAG TPA: hypothetical protein [Caudoviricetes sp.]
MEALWLNISIEINFRGLLFHRSSSHLKLWKVMAK